MGSLRNMRSAYRLTGLRLVACRLRKTALCQPTYVSSDQPLKCVLRKDQDKSATTLSAGYSGSETRLDASIPLTDAARRSCRYQAGTQQ